MTKEIEFYLDGMIRWTALARKDQVWVWVNRPEFCPASAALDMMAE